MVSSIANHYSLAAKQKKRRNTFDKIIGSDPIINAKKNDSGFASSAGLMKCFDTEDYRGLKINSCYCSHGIDPACVFPCVMPFHRIR